MSATLKPGTVTATLSLGSLNIKAAAAHATADVAGAPTDVAAVEQGQPKLENFKIAVFSSQQYVLDFLEAPLEAAFPKNNVKFFESRLKLESAPLARGFDAVCAFVNDRISEAVIQVLAEGGVRFLAMRCAGFDKVDVAAAAKYGLKVVRVPAYSPRSVAEHALALTFTLARNLHLTHQRVAAGNYTLSGLVGFELSGKTFGIVGTGKIGLALIKLLQGFDCTVLCYDVYKTQEAERLGGRYVSLEELLSQADIVSLHTPLLTETFHLMDQSRLALMKPTAYLINVSRGGLVNTAALLNALQEGRLGGCAMDVYENEGPLFFRDYTRFSPLERLKNWDRQFEELISLPNVLITPHSAFLTNEALSNIAETTISNLKACAMGEPLINEVRA
ncbi:hypothetical protein N2152v2_003263 [Parachlorella kessleri]